MSTKQTPQLLESSHKNPYPTGDIGLFCGGICGLSFMDADKLKKEKTNKTYVIAIPQPKLDVPLYKRKK